MSDLPQTSQFLIYRAENGAIKIDVRFENETVWLTQPLMAELFQATQQNISLHLRNIYEEGELQPEATHKEFLSVRREGSREVQQYLVFAEGQAMRRIPMHMRDWIAKLDGFLGRNDRDILTHAGSISHELAVRHAETQYDAFHQQRLQEGVTRIDDFERAIRRLPKPKPAPRRKKKGQP